MILAADSEGPDQTAHPRSLIWAFAAQHMFPEGTFSLRAARMILTKVSGDVQDGLQFKAFNNSCETILEIASFSTSRLHLTVFIERFSSSAKRCGSRVEN